MQYQIPGIIRQYDGSTQQQTNPVPGVSQPQVLARFDINRIVGAPPRFEGATVQRTEPLPPKPSFPTPYRVTRQLLGAPKHLDGPTTDTNSYIFPTGQPVTVAPRVQQVPVAQRFENPVVVVSRDVFPINPAIVTAQPRQQPGLVVFFDGATRQQTYIFPVSQPLNYLPLLQPVAAPARIEGPTSQQTHPVPPVSQPQRLERFDVNRIVGAPVRLEGATAQQTYIFPVSQPYLKVPTQQPDCPRYWYGSTIQRTDPIPGVSQPQTLAPFDVNRLAGAPPRFEGAVIAAQQTYIFPPNQPMVYLASRQPLDAPRYWYGATNQQQYIFPVSQPVTLADKRQQPLLTIPRFEGDSTWFGYPLSQPIKTVATQQPVPRYLDIPRATQVDLPLTVPNPYQVPRQQSIQQPRFEGATNQQTYIFPTGQPLNYLPWRLPIEAPRFYDGIITPPIRPIRPIGFAVSASPTGTIQSAGSVGVVLSGSPKGNIV